MSKVIFCFILFVFIKTSNAQNCNCNSLFIAYKKMLISYSNGNVRYAPAKPITYYYDGSTSRKIPNKDIRYIRLCTGINPDKVGRDSTYTLDSNYLNKVRLWLKEKECTKIQRIKERIIDNERVNKLDSNMQKQGRWVLFRKKKIYISGTFTNNLRDGSFYVYYSSGNIFKSISFKNDLPIIESTKYYYDTPEKKIAAQIDIDSLSGAYLLSEYDENGRINQQSVTLGPDISQFDLFYNYGDILMIIPRLSTVF